MNAKPTNPGIDDTFEGAIEMPPGESGRGEGASIIEAALSKIAPNRQVIVRQGSEVVPGPELAPILDLSSERGEEVRALRTSLLLLRDGGALSLAVLSPGRREGRSRLAAELALAFAQLGKRTLLIDADLRNTRLHELFNCTPELGLSDSIAFHALPHVHPVQGFPHLHLVTAGNSKQVNPLEFLSDHRLARMLEDWRRNYTYIIIDTPAAAEYADALAVAALAQNVLIVSRTNQTGYRQLGEMMRKLSMTPCYVLGAVVSHT